MTVIVLDSYGVSVSLHSRRLVVTKTESQENGEKVKKKTAFPLMAVSGLVVSKGVYVSSPALIALMQNGIPVLWLYKNKITGVSHSFHSHGTVLVRRQQFEASNNAKGLELMKGFVRAGMVNKSRVLKMYARNRRQEQPDLSHALETAAFSIEEQITGLEFIQGEPNNQRHSVMGIEGITTRAYYEAIQMIIPGEYEFEGRTKRPPCDPVNAALSYGYMILNARAYLCCCMTGLDPYGGYLHVDRSGRPALSIDLAEEFRQAIVDRAILKLAVRNILDPVDHFEERDGGVYLATGGKQLVVGEINKRLQTRCRSTNNEQITHETALLRQARNISRFLTGKTANYQPFLMEW